MGKPKAPPPPDYAAAATAQGAANTQSAIATNFLNQANQVGPYGSLSYTYDNTPGTGQTLADGTVIPRTTATTTLSPGQQTLLDQNTSISTNLNNLALQGIGYVGQTANRPIDQSSLPSLRAGLGTTDMQNSYNFSNVGAMPSSSDFTADRDRITDAMMQRMQPYMDRQREALDTRLANQGITHGSEAYASDYDVHNRGVNDQRLGALIAGDQEQQRLFQNAMGIRQQGVGEAVQQGNFNNTSLGNEFNQGLASGQFNNQARQQAIQEQDYFRNQPLNMLNALRSGNQVTTPQFGNVSAGSNIAAAPVYQASQDQYAAAMQQYQAQMQARSGLLGGIAGIGSAAIMASDRRLKVNIKPLGIKLGKLMLYAYDYIWGGPRQIGVMADEIAIHRPDALGPVLNGYATVNYGAL